MGQRSKRKRLGRVNLTKIQQGIKLPDYVFTPPTKYNNTIIQCSKNIYSRHVAEVYHTNLASKRAAAYRQKHDIVVGSSDKSMAVVPNPIDSLNAIANVPESISPQLLACGNVSPMQSQCWPIILQGLDMIAVGLRGPDRTMAYLVPAILHISAQTTLMQPTEGPIVLVLTPTAAHGKDVYEIASHFWPYKRVAVFTGTSARDIRVKFSTGLDMAIVVGGIGKQMLDQNMMNLKFCSMVIMDDVEALMVTTNVKSLYDIMEYAPAGRQTLCFSQSWCVEAQELAVAHMPNGFCTVDVGKFHRDVQLICRQQAHILNRNEDRMEYVANLILTIQSWSSGKILIFIKDKDTAKQLTNYLRLTQLSVVSLGETEALQCASNIFVASDSAAKKYLDIDDIDHVIHFNYSHNFYGIRLTHMSRSSTNGSSHIILDQSEAYAAKFLIQQLKYGNQEISTELKQLQTQHQTEKGLKVMGAIGSETHEPEKNPKVTVAIDSDTHEITYKKGKLHLQRQIKPKAKAEIRDNIQIESSNSKNENSIYKQTVSSPKRFAQNIQPNVVEISSQPPFTTTSKTTATQQWNGADSILARILDEEETVKIIATQRAKPAVGFFTGRL